MKVDIEPFVAIVIVVGILGAMFIGQYNWNVCEKCDVCHEVDVDSDEQDGGVFVENVPYQVVPIEVGAMP